MEEWRAIWKAAAITKEMQALEMPEKMDARKMDHLNHLLMSEICGVCMTRDDGKGPLNIRCDTCLRWTHKTCTKREEQTDSGWLPDGQATRYIETDETFVCKKCVQ